MKLFAADEFAARRRASQTDIEDALRPIVAKAVDLQENTNGWTELLRAVQTMYGKVFADESGGDSDAPPLKFMRDLEATLKKTKTPRTENTVERITVWLATAILSMATIEASAQDEEDLFLEWVDMHDADVRPAHKKTNGQVRPIGEPFDVDGVEMPYPGWPGAPIELWINCRCTLRPTLAEEELVAAAEPDESADRTGLCVVALPVQDSEVNSIGEEQKHVTLLYVGDADEATGATMAAIATSLTETYEPFTASVSGSGMLGPDKAKVLFVEAHEFNALRGAFEQDEQIGMVLRATDTHPHFVPHMTITYDEALPDEAGQQTDITFDRLAVWHGETQTEYPLGGTVDTEQITEEPTEDLTAAAAPDAVRVPWHGVLAPEGIRSGDGRKFKEGSLRMRDLPLPLTWQKVSDDGHKGNVTVATIEKAEVVDGLMKASGFFLGTPEADEVVGLIGEFGRFGVSVDADDSTFEVDEEAEEVVFTDARICAACIVPIPAFMEAWVALGDWPSSDSEPEPVEVDEELVASVEAAGGVDQFIDVAPGRTEDGPGWLTHPVDTDRLRDYWVRGPGAAKIKWGVPGDFNRCRVQVAKYVKPQHLNGYCANRHYDALGFWPGRAPSEQVAGDHIPFAGEAMGLKEAIQESISLVAAGGYCAPSEWFKDPEFVHGDERLVKDPATGQYGCPLNVTDEGQVFGHVALWESCHIGYPGTCTSPPHSETAYAHFLTGEVPLDNGERVPVGQITLGGGHAAPRQSLRQVLAHYDSTSAAVADITVGEDEFGIWCAGWVRPGTSDEMVTALRASALSGDWRRIGPHPREMVAALAVNVPGFGIPRVRVGMANGEQVSLVASGVVQPGEEAVEAASGLDMDALAAAVVEQLAIRQRNAERMKALAAQVKGDD